VAGNAAVFLCALAATGDTPLWQPALAALVSLLLAGLMSWRLPRLRVFSPAVAAALLLGAGAWLSAHSPDDRRVLLAAAALTVFEVAVVSAVAMFFSAFSSPFLTAVFTFGIFIVGRSADTLANLPTRTFGEAIHVGAALLSRVVPNLMVYVPERALLTGEALGSGASGYLSLAALQALGWSAVLLSLASLLFARRDLT
jgi:ABC-type transport system involved in multi-copper enzyme maturation permease subunit